MKLSFWLKNREYRVTVKEKHKNNILVELNGGEVLIRSTVDKGTTVYVTVPSGGKNDEERPLFL